MEDKKKDKINWREEILDFLRMFLISAAVLLVVTHFVIQPIRVQGNSMFPTLHDQSVGFSNILLYHLQGLDRFDVVVVYIEEKDEFLVKRVVGLPNETIEYRADQLYVNGEAVQEDFLDPEYCATHKQGENFTADFGPVTLGEDEYFALGDNRPNSSDSRVYGPFKKEQIKTKDAVILFPFSQIGVH